MTLTVFVASNPALSPVELASLREIHSVDAAVLPSRDAPFTTTVGTSVKEEMADAAAAEVAPPLPPRRASEPPTVLQPTKHGSAITRKPILTQARPVDRPLPTTMTPDTTMTVKRPVQQYRSTNNPRLSPQPSPQLRSRPSTPLASSEGRRQPHSQLQGRPPSTGSMVSRNAAGQIQNRSIDENVRRSSPQMYPAMAQASKHNNSRYQRPLQQSVQAQQVAGKEPRRESRMRRIMQHPATRIATRMGPALIAGGAIGAQVGGIMDQWSGASAVPIAGGAGGPGFGAPMLLSSGDDGGGEGYEEQTFEEQTFEEQYYQEQDAYGAGGTGWEDDAYGTGSAGWQEDTAAYDAQNLVQDDTVASSSSCIEDDPTYSSMMANGGYNIQY